MDKNTLHTALVVLVTAAAVIYINNNYLHLQTKFSL